jgi:hypothetical protein
MNVAGYSTSNSLYARAKLGRKPKTPRWASLTFKRFRMRALPYQDLKVAAGASPVLFLVQGGARYAPRLRLTSGRPRKAA